MNKIALNQTLQKLFGDGITGWREASTPGPITILSWEVNNKSI